MGGVYHRAQVCDGYTGAELGQAIIDAMYQAFAEGRHVHTADIAVAIPW